MEVAVLKRKICEPRTKYIWQSYILVFILVVLATGLSFPANAATNTKSVSIYFNSKSAKVNTSNLLKLSNIVDDIVAKSGKSIKVNITGFTPSKGATALDSSDASKRFNNVL